MEKSVVEKNNVKKSTLEKNDINEKIIIEKLDIVKGEQPLTFAYSINHQLPDSHILHINRFYEIHIFVQGDTDYIVGDTYFSLKSGDIIIINPYEVHKAVLKSTALYERFYFLVPTNLFHAFSFDPIQQILSGNAQKKNLISLPEEDREKTLKLLYQILEVLENDNSNSGQFTAYGLFIQFITLLSSKYFAENPVHENRLPRLIGDILKYVNENLTQIDSIDQIATHFSVSLPYLSATFKNAIGTPIVKYIQTRKIAYSKTLLDQDWSVTDACYESGFNDCAYFIKIFKQHTGMTPLQYKKVR